MIFVARI